MTAHNLGRGGFDFPIVYQKNQKQIEKCLSQGAIDYAEISKWSFPDEFLCFVWERKLLEFINNSYPNPREKNEVPIWFLICCQFVMRLHQTGNYHHLGFLLNSGSLLTRFGFNIGAKKIGFNGKNKKTRKTVIHADTARKFFKDTNPMEIRKWYRNDLQKWFREQRTFDHRGIFVLDQSHLVVPDNENYKNAVKMPVDEHGQLYHNLSSLTAEQKQELVYHRCYTLSTLLNVALERPQFHVAGYELGAGNEDELPQADRLVPAFCRQFNGVMKLLIIDRGYIDGEFIEKIKRDHNVDVLIPLKKNMIDAQDAISIATMQNKWECVAQEKNTHGKIILKKEIAPVKNLSLWDNFEGELHACTTRYTYWDHKKEKYDERYAALVSTRNFTDPKEIIQYYDLRIQTEERFRQFKHAWYITDFPSPHEALVESHVCFTLLTYSLLQLYLQRKDLQEKTHQMISTLRRDERLGIDAVLVYAQEHYGIFDLDDYTARVAGLQETPRQRLIRTMEVQKEARLKREQQ
jgi:Transposase DDE domain